MGLSTRGLVPLAMVAVACSSSGDAVAPLSERVAFSHLTNLIPADITIAGVTGTAYVDTGNPVVLVDPLIFRSTANLAATGGDISLDVAGAVDGVMALAIPTTAGLASPDPLFPIAANMGCSALCGYVATFNYRDVAFGLATAPPTPPAGLEPETVAGFSLEGGETIDGVTLPRSRVVVTVTLEGHDYSMIVDTGASFVTISQAAFGALAADGRAQISGGAVETTSGVSESTLARAAAIVVGGAEVDSVVVAHDPSFDMNLQVISTEVGHTIDGSLGGTFLHDFFVTIDYPASMLHLARYTDLGFALDPAHRLGIQLALTLDGGAVVEAVSTTAAAQGIAIGDEVTSIDGVTLAGIDPSQIIVQEYGPVGARRQVTFGRGFRVAYQTLPVAVEEYLPQ